MTDANQGAAVRQALLKLRQPAALLLVAYVGVDLFLGVLRMFVDSGPYGGDFADRLSAQRSTFLSTFNALLVLAAVALVALGELTAKARVITLVALVEAGLSTFLGLVAWLTGFAGLDEGMLILTHLLGGLAQLAFVGSAAYLVYVVFAALPKPAAPQRSYGAYAQAPGAPYPQPGQPFPGQPTPGGSYPQPGQPFPGQPTPGGSYPQPGQPFPGQPTPGGPYAQPGQPFPGQQGGYPQPPYPQQGPGQGQQPPYQQG